MTITSSTILDNPVPITLPSGRQLSTYVLGDGEDLVIFEAGGGAAGASWGKVVEALSPLTSARIMIYNRAGYGSSHLAWDRRTLSDISQDLRDLIETQTYRRLILIGHSYGGPIIRTVATSGVPVTGIVLVDGTDETCPSYYSEMEGAFQKNSWQILRGAIWGTYATRKREQLKGMPEPYLSAAVADSTSLKAAWASSYEVYNLVSGLRELRDSEPELDQSVALTAISAELPRGRPLRMELNAAHRARAEKQGARGKFILAENSGHNIYSTQPEVIAREIAALLPDPPTGDIE